GSDLILTNSFGGNRYRLKLHRAQDRLEALNQAAARLARSQAAVAGRPVVVAGSLGPTGELLAPLGPLSEEQATAAFAEQAQALARGGVDMLWIETISSLEELRAAYRGAISTGLPVACTLSFDSNGRTMMGLAPQDLATFARQGRSALVACGANCGISPAELLAAILNLGSADPDTPMVAKANCGIPHYQDGELVYDGTPAVMADYARLAVDAGARIIGGCCGTTFEHIRAIKEALEDYRPGPRPDLETVVARLGEVSTGARAQWRGELNVLAGAASGPRERRGGRRRGH
ncbi:MAG: betaine--homocysteine S-methyltransferase, partial [Candidatus Competibacteraceae bacterium]|nr:betaine--homocysteine S-methyltransferase [Candidatus Competibacteraceae bacterium]